jgi:hypothetical protein
MTASCGSDGTCGPTCVKDDNWVVSPWLAVWRGLFWVFLACCFINYSTWVMKGAPVRLHVVSCGSDVVCGPTCVKDDNWVVRL